MRLALPLVLAVVAVAQFASPGHTQSQQAPSEYLWAVVPNGVFADLRIRDALGELVTVIALQNEAGSSVRLRYGGEVVGGPTGSNEKGRLLLAAAGFNEPASQLREVRRCRIWLPSGATSDEQQQVLSSLSKNLFGGLSTVGLASQPCEAATSPDQADFVTWRASDAAPIALGPGAEPRMDVGAFIVPVLQPVSPRPVQPPVTGDGGLVGR